MISDSIMILGATASGKTKLAAHIAYNLNGEIISADSRQVYSELNIGAGKDLEEYNINSINIPYHLINVQSIQEKFYLKDFVLQSKQAKENIITNGKLPIICGGTGLYLDALIKNLDRIFIPENEELRVELELLDKDLLVEKLISYNGYEKHKFDLKSKKRLIRAIEIMSMISQRNLITAAQPLFKPLILGIETDIITRKNRITERLNVRLANGLIEEVEELLKNKFPAEQLILLGLEYKFITEFLIGRMDKKEMLVKLEIAIHQFAKRQCTWFRKMEKEGFHIHWIDGTDRLENQIHKALLFIHNNFASLHK